MSAFFVQSCSRCQRRVRVALEYMGHAKQCPHCSHAFIVQDSELESAAAADPIQPWAMLKPRDEVVDLCGFRRPR